MSKTKAELLEELKALKAENKSLKEQLDSSASPVAEDSMMPVRPVYGQKEN